MNTKALSDLFARHEEIISREKTTRASLAKIATERTAVMEKASGPDDESALAQLNVLASQENLANRELALNLRQLEGSKLMLLNEAVHLRNGLLDALKVRRAKIVEKLDAALGKFYPNAKQRAALVKAMDCGNDAIPQAAVIQPIYKAMVGLRGLNFNPRDESHEAYAKSVLGMAERAVRALEAN